MPPRRRALQKPKAVISYLADDNASNKVTSNLAKGVIERVKKCFDRANHKNANEQEARAASRMAAKYMEQHQISQADLMIHEDALQRERRGGMSAVDIWPAKEGGRLFTPGWVDLLRGAIGNFFDCRYFSTHRENRIEWTFYGIPEHTISAAIAAEAIYNQIEDWSERFIGIQARNSYCLGVADGFLTLSKDEKKAAERQARETEVQAIAARIREEEADDIARLSRLENPQPVPALKCRFAVDLDVDGQCEDLSGSTSDEEDSVVNDTADNEVLPDFIEDGHVAATTVDTEADFDAELQNFMRPKREEADDDEVPALPLRENSRDGILKAAQWSSMRQLTTFREMSHEIEDNVLRANKIKLCNSRSKRGAHLPKDKNAYREGKRDSEKIQVRAARIGSRGDNDGQTIDMSG